MDYAFIDEAGNVAISAQSHFLIVAALCTETPRYLERAIRKTQKKFGSALSSGELKGKKSNDRLAETVLKGLQGHPIKIYAVIIGQDVLKTIPEPGEEIYRWAAARLVRKVVGQSPRTEIVLDRRYTKESLRYQLEKIIREEISDLPQQYVLIRQEDSLHRKELQAVDFIAWSFFQKYERGNSRYYEIIQPCIVEEEVITKRIRDNAWK
ncbi:MAG: DUF3800 domain-containing protein [Chloroflexota bacterium]